MSEHPPPPTPWPDPLPVGPPTRATLPPPPPPLGRPGRPGRSRAATVAMAVVALLLVVLFVGVVVTVALDGDEGDPGASAPPAATATATTAPSRNSGLGDPVEYDFDYYGPVGTCTAAVTYAPVPCGQEHLGEVFAHITVAGDAYPGKEALRARAAECGDRFTELAGGTPTERRFLVLPAPPDESAWADGLHDIICVAFSPGPEVTGSIADG